MDNLGFYPYLRKPRNGDCDNLHVLSGIVVFFFWPCTRKKNKIGGRKRGTKISGAKKPILNRRFKAKEQGSKKKIFHKCVYSSKEQSLPF